MASIFSDFVDKVEFLTFVYIFVKRFQLSRFFSGKEIGQKNDEKFQINVKFWALASFCQLWPAWLLHEIVCQVHIFQTTPKSHWTMLNYWNFFQILCSLFTISAKVSKSAKIKNFSIATNNFDIFSTFQYLIYPINSKIHHF